MSTTRTCPRCKTENDVARSNCQQCGGVMLGVGVTSASDGTVPRPSRREMPEIVRGSSVASAIADSEQNRGSESLIAGPDSPVALDPDIATAVHARLARMQNVSPEKRALIEKMLVKRLAQNGKAVAANVDGSRQASTSGLKMGCTLVAALAILGMGASTLLFVHGSTKLQEKFAELTSAQSIADKLHVPMPPIALPSAPTADDVQTDPVATDKLDEPLVNPAQGAGQVGKTLNRAQLHPLRGCFRGNGYPTERPMSFGIAIEPKAGSQAVTVFAMTDVQVPPGVVACLLKRVPAQNWAPGVWFADWPNDNAWP